MAQQVIQVGTRVGADGEDEPVMVLFSPVLAHALRRGDLIVTGWADMPTVRLTSPPAHTVNHWGRAVLFDTPHGSTLEFGFNEPILRAVGAGVGGVA